METKKPGRPFVYLSAAQAKERFKLSDIDWVGLLTNFPQGSVPGNMGEPMYKLADLKKAVKGK